MIVKLNHQNEIETLQQQYRAKRELVSRSAQSPHLWIVGDQLAMDIPANRLIRYPQTLVLRRSKDKWDRIAGQKKQDPAIEYGVKKIRISQLIICGHSFSMADGETLPPHSLEDPSAADANPLLSRVRTREQVNVIRRKQVLEWLQQVNQLQVVQESIAAGTLKLQAFFYMSESGIYQQYDPATERFTAGHDC